MNSAKEVAEKYFPKDPHDSQLLELDILRLIESQQIPRWWNGKPIGHVEHEHKWEDEYINYGSITTGGLYLVCSCGAKRLKYQTF